MPLSLKSALKSPLKSAPNPNSELELFNQMEVLIPQSLVAQLTKIAAAKTSTAVLKDVKKVETPKVKEFSSPQTFSRTSKQASSLSQIQKLHGDPILMTRVIKSTEKMPHVRSIKD